ncbi:MAG TPA: hypothetical protein VF766_06915 [Pyrinomonadaceae bacterium]
MHSLRCSNCSFLNFGSDPNCKRCKATLNASSEVPETNYFGGYAPNLQPDYQTASDYSQTAYQPQYFPTPVSPLPRTSKHGGTNAVLLSLLGVVVAVAAGLGVLWKFGKPTSTTLSWQEYKAEDGSFTVEMPTKPVEDVVGQETSLGTLDTHTIAGNMGRDGIYVVAYTDFPVDATKVPASRILDGAAQGTVKNSGATMVSKKDITLDGYPGLEIEMTVPPSQVPGGGLAVCRIYWAAPRMYVMLVGGAESSEVYRDRAKFLDSFKLQKKLALAYPAFPFIEFNAQERRSYSIVKPSQLRRY